MMGKGNFSDDFKRDAVAQISERGYPVSEVSERLGNIRSLPQSERIDHRLAAARVVVKL
jgi:transposase-like protein